MRNFIFLFLVLLCFCQNPNEKLLPKASKGVLDLRGGGGGNGHAYSLLRDVIKLDGEWEFYWEEFLPPNSLGSIQKRSLSDATTNQVHIEVPVFTHQPKPNYIPVPSQWQNHGYPTKGYATYRLKVLLPKNIPELSLFRQYIGTASRMFINGKLVSSIGKIGTSRKQSIPIYRYNKFDLEKSSSELEIVIYVSNFHHYQPGISNSIIIGPTKILEKKQKQRYSLDLILFSSLMIMGLYHLGLYLNRKKDFSPLYFALFCILVSFRSLAIGERILMDIFPFLPFAIVHKIEYLTFYSGAFIFLQFIHSLYPDEASRPMYWIISSIMIPCSILVVVTPMYIYNYSLVVIQITTFIAIVYILIILIRAILHKRIGSKLFFAGILLFFGTVIHDILENLGIVFTPPLTSYGFLSFILFQSLILSKKFANAFTQIEELSENLEHKVQERTLSLEESKLEIETLNHFTYLINSKSSLKDIFKEISMFVYAKYSIRGVWLFLPNNKGYLYTYKAYSYDRIPLEYYNFMMNLNIPLNESGGFFYKVYERKKAVYLPKIKKSKFEIDKKMLGILSAKSIFCIPLISKSECVGILAFSNLSKQMKLQKKERDSLSSLCSQIAGVIETIHLLQQVEIAKEETEKAKEETERLNDLSKLVNSTTDLDQILRYIYKYIEKNLGIDAFWLILIDKEHNELYTYDGVITPVYQDIFDYEFFFKFRLKLSEKVGTLYQTYIKKVPLYIPNLKNFQKKGKEIFFQNQYNQEYYYTKKMDLKVVLKGNFESLLQFPLLLKGETIGILSLASYHQEFKMQKEDIQSIERLCENITGAIQNSVLLKETEEARKQADIEKGIAIFSQQETEMEKQETEKLNQLIKSLNEDLDIQVIMEKVLHYIQFHYNIYYYGLLLTDKDIQRVYLNDFKLPNSMSDKNIIKNTFITLDQDKGAHNFAYRTKKAFYIRNEKRISALTEEEYFIYEKTKLKSLLILPLIRENLLIGFLDLFNIDKMNISKEEITRLSILSEQLAGIIYSSNLFRQVKEERQKSEKLLLNILPEYVAGELKEKGFAESVSVLFTDFKDFTKIAESMVPKKLVEELDRCFSSFDSIMEKYGLEKLKTIGDSYMCAGGIPKQNLTHAIDCALAALEIQEFMKKMKKEKETEMSSYWELRLGIHSGSLVAGVIGKKKFTYDVWGDTVNTASRMESSGTPGRVNISETTYKLVQEFFDCEYRGRIQAKNKGGVNMYYLNRIKQEFSKDKDRKTPNDKFWERYRLLEVK